GASRPDGIAGQQALVLVDVGGKAVVKTLDSVEETERRLQRQSANAEVRVIMRCPETASNRRSTSSRSRKQYRKTVMAPMSMAWVPSHTRCELMRVSSFNMTR